MAEYYHIYDYRSVPCRLLGTLVSGLKADSRIGMLREGIKVSPEVLMLVRIHDILAQVFCEKGQEPKTLIEQCVIEDKPKSDYQGFKSVEAFEKAWSDINRSRDGE